MVKRTRIYPADVLDWHSAWTPEDRGIVEATLDARPKASWMYTTPSNEYIAIYYDFRWPLGTDFRHGRGIIIHRGQIRWHDVHNIPRSHRLVRERLREDRDDFDRQFFWLPLSGYAGGGVPSRRAVHAPEVCTSCFMALPATGVCDDCG